MADILELITDTQELMADIQELITDTLELKIDIQGVVGMVNLISKQTFNDFNLKLHLNCELIG